jgi:hypothetical protein
MGKITKYFLASCCLILGQIIFVWDVGLLNDNDKAKAAADSARLADSLTAIAQEENRLINLTTEQHKCCCCNNDN